MSDAATYTTKRLDHLGLVAGFCQEINLSAIIDNALGTSERKQVSYGQIFTAMILNGLGFTGFCSCKTCIYAFRGGHRSNNAHVQWILWR